MNVYSTVIISTISPLIVSVLHWLWRLKAIKVLACLFDHTALGGSRVLASPNTEESYHSSQRQQLSNNEYLVENIVRQAHRLSRIIPSADHGNIKGRIKPFGRSANQKPTSTLDATLTIKSDYSLSLKRISHVG